jgi:molybdopterin-containing oxidoreductase family membrane subunit
VTGESRFELGEEAIFLEPIRTTGKRFYLTVLLLALVILWAAVAYLYQYHRGLGITGLARPIFGSTSLISSSLSESVTREHSFRRSHVCQAEWRRSITRSAEVITVLVLFFGVGNILIDLGDLIDAQYYQVFPISISPALGCSKYHIYLTASSIYLFLPLIPDIAILRDHAGKWNRFYRILALGWQGTERQHRLLEMAIAFMAILVIPVAISVHTVVSFVFAMTIQPMWHSAIFGPYFVAGAIFSGIAALIVAMNVIRKAYHLEGYLRPVHFNNLGILLLVMTLLWFYFLLPNTSPSSTAGSPST